MNASNVERGAARTFSLQLWRQHIAGYAASLAVNRIVGCNRAIRAPELNWPILSNISNNWLGMGPVTPSASET